MRGRWTRAACLGVPLMLAAPLAWAQQSNYIGLGIGVGPRYEGSDAYKAKPLPLIRYETEHFFVSPRGGGSLGIKFEPWRDVSTGVFVGLGSGRDEDDDDRLDGMGDIDFHAVYGAFVDWSPGRYQFSAAWRQAAKSGYGGSLELEAGYQLVRTSRDVVTLGVNTVWSNGPAMQTWFGVTPRQSLRSHGQLQAYDADAGFRNLGLYARWHHRFNDRWGVMTMAGVKTLLGDARDSPIVERKTGFFGGVGLTYAF